MSLLRTAGRAAVASSVHGRVQRRQQSRWSAAAPAEGTAPAPAPTPPAPAPAPTAPAPAPAPPAAPSGSLDDQLAQLAKLGQLRDAGVLTEVEFEVQKDRILRG